MDNIRQRFDQTLSDHLKRLLGTRSGVAELPFDLMNISLVIFLAEIAANERDQMISADDRYTREALYTELTEVGLGSKPQFNQAIEDMFSRAYIYEDDAGRLEAGGALIEMAQLLDSVLPNMPGLNLIAYIAQTLDEATSGRKELEDAVSQFDQTLTLQGVLQSETHDPSPKIEKQTVGKKISEKSDSDEGPQHLIKSVPKEVEREPTRQSKVLSAKSQMQIKTVAFGKVQEVQVPEPRDPQQEACGPDSAEAGKDPEPAEAGGQDIEDAVPSEATLLSDSDASAGKPSIPENQDSIEPTLTNDQIEFDEAPDLNTDPESTGRLPMGDSSQEPSPDNEINSASVPASEDLQKHQAPIEASETIHPDLETSDDIVEEEISKFETDLSRQCPICKSAYIVSELTAKGKEYYKCPNKSCNFISWGKPFHNECPRCHNPFLIEAQKNGTNVLKCPRATCNYWQGGPETPGPSNQKSPAQRRTSKSGPPKRRRRVVKRRVVRRKK